MIGKILETIRDSAAGHQSPLAGMAPVRQSGRFVVTMPGIKGIAFRLLFPVTAILNLGKAGAG